MKTTNAPWLIVALREVETKVKDKAFIISTLLTLALIIGSLVVSSFLANRTSEFTVVATDQLSYKVLEKAQDERPEDLSLSIKQEAAATAEEQLSQGSIDATLASGDPDKKFTLTGFDEVDPQLADLISSSMTSVITDQLLSSSGIDSSSLPTSDDLSLAQLEGDSERSSMVRAMAFLFSFLFYMASFLFGMPIANSVIEEKQNRVVEILASAIKLRQLLAGKIIGNVLLAMVQLLLFISAGLLVAYLSPIEVPFLGIVAQVAGWFVVFFLGGFLVLAGIWAALGALATRTEDLQQSTGPVIGMLMAVLFIGLYAKGSVLVIASYIPIASSVAMPIRLLSGEVPLWEPLISLSILLATCWVVLLFSEKIYQRAVMHTGGVLTLRKALKLEV